MHNPVNRPCRGDYYAAVEALTPVIARLASRLAQAVRGYAHVAAADLAQEGCLGALLAEPRFNPARGSLKTFILTKARYGMRDYLRGNSPTGRDDARRRGLRLVFRGLPLEPLEALRQEEGPRGVDDRDCVEACLRRVTDKEAETLRLRFLDGRSVREVAASLGLSEAGVFERLRQAKRWLQATASPAGF